MMADLLDVLEDIPENLKNLIKDMIDESKEVVKETQDAKVKNPQGS